MDVLHSVVIYLEAAPLKCKSKKFTENMFMCMSTKDKKIYRTNCTIYSSLLFIIR